MKELKINVPEGYEIDEKNSTFECIKFKPVKTQKWRGDETKIMSGFYIDNHSNIHEVSGHRSLFNYQRNRNVFATEKQAKSSLAMAQISQIMANDERFGGVVTNGEWDDNILKYCISRKGNKVEYLSCIISYNFLAFHTEEQRNLFLKENEDLVRDYLMLD